MIKQKPLQIFSKDADMGIDVVKSPVKLTILEMLRSNDMEFDEIVRNTGKSKSTISVHLKSLREDVIISYRLGESDSRRKIFYLNSKYLGSVEVSKKLEPVYEKVAGKYGKRFMRAADYASPSEADQEHMDGQSHKILADAIYRKLEAEIL